MRPLRFLSLFSGLEAASLAWGPLGWTCAGVSEIEPFPCSLLEHRFPHAPNLGDVTRITEAQIAALGPLDLIVFGSPCQDLSTAGLRRGLAGDRSSLFFDAMRIVQWARKHCGARWALWENVYGALTSNDGRDFAAVVQHMADLPERPDVPAQGWGNEGVALGGNLLEWAALDAQWFGVAQRRRRIFCLADFGAWRDRPPVLLERDGLRGDRAPSREARQEPLAGTAGRAAPGRDSTLTRYGIAYTVPVAGTLSDGAHNGGGLNGQDAYTGRIFAVWDGDVPRVRRFTVRECERLMGIPDDHTIAPQRRQQDGPRFKAIANSIAVPVLRWIGQSIEFAHNY